MFQPPWGSHSSTLSRGSGKIMGLEVRHELGEESYPPKKRYNRNS